MEIALDKASAKFNVGLYIIYIVLSVRTYNYDYSYDWGQRPPLCKESLHNRSIIVWLLAWTGNNSLFIYTVPFIFCWFWERKEKLAHFFNDALQCVVENTEKSRWLKYREISTSMQERSLLFQLEEPANKDINSLQALYIYIFLLLAEVISGLAAK